MARPKKGVAPQKHYFMKFVFSDWVTDGSLSLCSLAARGLWIEMLCRMGMGEERGFLTLQGRALSDEDVARMLRVPFGEFAALLHELERAAVFSRDDRGAIYCRRMARAVEEAEEGRKHAAKRWSGRGKKEANLRVVGGTDARHDNATKPAKAASGKGENPNGGAYGGATVNNYESGVMNPPPIPPEPPPREEAPDWWVSHGGRETGSTFTDPRPRPGVRVQKPRDWERELIHFADETDRKTGLPVRVRVCGGVLWDGAQRDTRSILGWGNDYAVDWEPLARWCAAGLTWQDIEVELKAGRDRMGDNPITSLRFFDKAMRLRADNKRQREAWEAQQRAEAKRRMEQQAEEARRRQAGLQRAVGAEEFDPNEITF